MRSCYRSSTFFLEKWHQQLLQQHLKELKGKLRSAQDLSGSLLLSTAWTSCSAMFCSVALLAAPTMRSLVAAAAVTSGRAPLILLQVTPAPRMLAAADILLAVMSAAAIRQHVSSRISGCFESAKAQLLQHVRPEGDHWVLVRCGDWQQHPLGWQGPACGLLQMWRLGETQEYDYRVHAVDPDGKPTGKQYNSLRGGCLCRPLAEQVLLQGTLTSPELVYNVLFARSARSSWEEAGDVSVCSGSNVSLMK
jgi:hypothetical protein